jgi:hypothetical protein
LPLVTTVADKYLLTHALAGLPLWHARLPGML